jgi:hypothetical protein
VTVTVTGSAEAFPLTGSTANQSAVFSIFQGRFEVTWNVWAPPAGVTVNSVELTLRLGTSESFSSSAQPATSKARAARVLMKSVLNFICGCFYVVSFQLLRL